MAHGVEHWVIIKEEKKKNQETPAEHTLRCKYSPTTYNHHSLEHIHPMPQMQSHTLKLTHTHTRKHTVEFQRSKNKGWQNTTWDDPFSPVPEAGESRRA